MFSGLKSGLSKMGAKVKGGVEDGVHKIGQKIEERTALLKHFRQGNVVQLISKASGKVVQMVEKDEGKLGLNALGEEGAENAQGCWTISGEPSEACLHNNKKYIAIIDGTVKLQEIDDESKIGPEGKFNVTQDGIFVHLESLQEKGRHLGFVPCGDLKSPSICVKEDDGKFGVKLILNAHPEEAEAENGKDEEKSEEKKEEKVEEKKEEKVEEKKEEKVEEKKEEKVEEKKEEKVEEKKEEKVEEKK